MQDALELSPKGVRRARTRTLIQLGGLIEKAGLTEALGIPLGRDLQKDRDVQDSVQTLYGALLEIQALLHPPGENKDLWLLKGKEAFKQAQ